MRNTTKTAVMLLCSATVVGTVAISLNAPRRPDAHATTLDLRGQEIFAQHMAPVMALQKQAMEAERAGNYTEAEDLYHRCIEIEPTFLAALPLSKLHDRMGKYKKAIAEYKQLFSLDGSFRNDAWMLTRCADLDMLYGSKADARKEYLAAASQPGVFQDKTFAPIAAGEDVSMNAPLNVLRACAYYNASLHCLSQDGEIGLRYMALALSLEPRSSLMRWGYARPHHYTDAMAQNWLAERQATGPIRAAIHKWRVQENQINSANTIGIRNGAATDTLTVFTPTRPISTPHVPDPIKLGNPRWADGAPPITAAP